MLRKHLAHLIFIYMFYVITADLYRLYPELIYFPHVEIVSPAVICI